MYMLDYPVGHLNIFHKFILVCVPIFLDASVKKDKFFLHRCKNQPSELMLITKINKSSLNLSVKHNCVARILWSLLQE